MRIRDLRTSLQKTLFAAVTCCALDALAQPEASPSQDGLPAIAYEAPPGCPDRSDFMLRVRARQRGAARDGAATQLRQLDVQIEVLPDRVIGHIAVTDAVGARAERRIEAASCAEASDALALIAALALDAGPAIKAAGPTNAASAVSESGTEADARAGAPPAQEPVAPPGRAQAKEPDAAAHAVETLQPSRDDDAPGSETDAPRAARTRFGVFASGLAVGGATPELQPGFQLATTFAGVVANGPELGLRVGWRIAPALTQERAEGVVAFSWWSGFGALCAGLRDAGDSASLWGCAAFEAGRLSASASETQNARDVGRLWAALGPGVVLQWEPAPSVAMQVGADTLFALRRDRFLLADATVHRASTLGIRVELGVGVQVW